VKPANKKLHNPLATTKTLEAVNRSAHVYLYVQTLMKVIVKNKWERKHKDFYM